jgi:hypothetical protein
MCARLQVDPTRIRCEAFLYALESVGGEQAKDDALVQLVWADEFLPLDVFLKAIKPTASINKIPMLDVLCYKTNFFTALSRLRELPAGITEFAPPTYVLPGELDAFYNDVRHKKTSGPWIIKPAMGMCGVGLEIIENADQVKQFKQPAVLQEYLRPFLLKRGPTGRATAGFKWDFRLYTLVTISTDFSISIFLYQDGLARFCTHPYCEFVGDKETDEFAHFTNTSVNVKNPDHSFEFVTVQDVMKLIRKDFKNGESGALNPDELWDQIQKLVLLSVAALAPSIVAWTRIVTNEIVSSSNEARRQEPPFFQLLGIDVMVNKDGRPFVLEVNDRPSLLTKKATANGCLKKHMLTKALLVLFPKYTSFQARGEVYGCEERWIQLWPKAQNVVHKLSLSQEYSDFVHHVLSLKQPNYPTPPSPDRDSKIEAAAWLQFHKFGKCSVLLTRAPPTHFYLKFDGIMVHRCEGEVPLIPPSKLLPRQNNFTFIPQRACRMEFVFPSDTLVDHVLMIRRSSATIAVRVNGRPLRSEITNPIGLDGEKVTRLAYGPERQYPKNGDIQVTVRLRFVDAIPFLQIFGRRRKVSDDCDARTASSSSSESSPDRDDEPTVRLAVGHSQS